MNMKRTILVGIIVFMALLSGVIFVRILSTNVQTDVDMSDPSKSMDFHSISDALNLDDLYVGPKPAWFIEPTFADDKSIPAQETQSIRGQ